jgi:hypothetical protein
MAISGPTGDYLMGGGICSSSLFDVSNDSEEKQGISEGKAEEDIASWWEGFGFENEGLLVLRDDQAPGGEALDGDNCHGEWGPPVELPGLESGAGSVRSSAGMKLGEEKHRAEDEELTKGMSANLNDLGSFLEFETWGLGGGGDM